MLSAEIVGSVKRGGLVLRIIMNMSLKDVDIESALRRLAERRIETAMEEGKFRNIEGMGKPLDLEPLPADEKARMMWWALRILKQNDVIPDEVRWRKAVEALRAKIPGVKSEPALDVLVHQINDLIRKLNTLGTNALPVNLAPLDLEIERRRLRERLAS
jgi:hypothetical protein